MWPAETGASGHHGFYYHFLDMQEGQRYDSWVELSSVDTALMMMGVLFTRGYYDQDDPREQSIREIADELYRRVEWPWLQVRSPLISMGWYRSEEHTSELQSLMRISYAVFCLKKKKKNT